MERAAEPPIELSLTAVCAERARYAGDLFDEWRDAPPQRRRHFFQISKMRWLRALQPLEPVRDFNYTHPFAHRPLIEFLLTIPADILCRPGEPRRLMRRALAGVLPPQIVGRRSKGTFTTPWLHALRPLAKSLLHATSYHIVDGGWVDAASFRERLRRITHGLSCNEGQLRRLVLLECWLRRSEPLPPLSLDGAA
jgi:hypothetical protein